MSTRAYIARETRQGSGQYEYVYNHFDGAPDSLGRILKRNFRNKAAVDRLIQGGEIEYIHPATGQIIRARNGGKPSSTVPDHQLHNMFYLHYIDYLYIYKRGKWTAISQRGEVEIP